MTRLNSIDFAAISPLLIILGGALLLLLLESFAEKYAKKWSFYLSALTILLAIGANYAAPISDNPLLTPWISFDQSSKIFTQLFLIIGLASVFLSDAFFQRFNASHGEYYFFVLSSLFGLLLIGQSADFLILFLGIETLSIPLYILCCYMKTWPLSRESALKYFLMGALASAFLLYGIALIYGAVGTTNLSSLLDKYQATHLISRSLFMGGVSLITLGLAFKAAIVPFHLWAPDVYDGAPSPVTAFMAVGTKTGAFAAFAKVFLIALPQFNLIWNEGISLLAYPTLLYANYVALRQIQLRRFFAYSGISHAGFLLLPLAAGTPDSLSALLFYLVIYAVATIGCFAVIAYLDHGSQGVMMHDLYGLFQRSPFLAGLMSLCLLTLAGIPPTAGFFAKFYIFKVAFEAEYYSLVVIALMTTILSAYYYLRILSMIFTKAPAKSDLNLKPWAAGFVGALVLILLIMIPLYPAPLLNLLAG
ncbi:MAG: NADH-quinone oxidoreductase subunit N [Chlamydiales bacterium 38-26]|nr:NADH-quinone oxidoreductase subunit N [Chlamydiales bacterium]OJV09357.1 MAG: NADH-quinone oxidoreductase subunit N [Chlamydiales bacterium 38-26]